MKIAKQACDSICSSILVFPERWKFGDVEPNIFCYYEDNRGINSIIRLKRKFWRMRVVYPCTLTFSILQTRKLKKAIRIYSRLLNTKAKRTHEEAVKNIIERIRV